ncbi:transporter substrate-binding domain-containing protein [Pseudomonas capeferrum]|uniref:substrate-binding periplasmic protein n=1 Tax=Pseudomonas capeferrum TaxID=1495066 RepID=UPI0015E2D582|nr:transporter substrate-binding domain-containing protein [Pseudomonas capeferrum]MBA1200931.1 transporter substrate-binding domain-containing protein [Pseudomonas capeferrum]
MWRLLAMMLLWASHSLADEPVLRFAVAESWSMPLMRTEGELPVEGILFDLMQAIARETGMRPEYHLMARLRLQQALEEGDIDVRCHVAADWLDDRPRNYLWSVPLIHQRDFLVGLPEDSGPERPEDLSSQSIGTVLGYQYPTLAALFDRGQLQREDSRNQLLVLQKLHAGRYRHALSNHLSLDWFNRQLPPAQRLRALAVYKEQDLGCMVRDDPTVPTQRVLRALARIKASGEIERSVARYTDSL